MDGKWRLMVTVRDAMRGGYDKLDIDQLQLEYTPDRFDNLFMCVFLDDSSSYFPLSILSPNMIDSWEVWKDFKPLGSNPYKKPVWVGYDPSFTGDHPALAVVAPPSRPFLSRLCGGEGPAHRSQTSPYFLSRLCGGEVQWL